MSHHDVVALLKSASSPVKLGLCRPKDLEEVLANRAKHIRGSVFSSSVLEVIDHYQLTTSPWLLVLIVQTWNYLENRENLRGDSGKTRHW